MTAEVIPLHPRPAVICTDPAEDNTRAIYALFARRALAALDAGVISNSEAQAVCDVIEKMLEGKR